MRLNSIQFSKFSSPPLRGPSPEASLLRFYSGANLASLREKFGSRFYGEILSLSQEKDPEMFFEGLLQFGMRLELAGKLEEAAEVFVGIVKAGSPLPVVRKAQGRLDAMRGVGHSGLRAEFLLNHLIQEVTDPSLLIGMGMASTAFRATRMAAINRMVPRLGANALALGAEAVTLPLGTRLADLPWGGKADWNVSLLGREVASSFILLGAVRLTGAVLGPKRGLWNQVGMLGGIHLAHRMEMGLGLRPRQDNATEFTDSLAMLLQFSVAGHLTRNFFGSPSGTPSRSRARVEYPFLRNEGDLKSPVPGVGPWPRNYGRALSSRPAPIRMFSRGGAGEQDLQVLAEFYRNRLPGEIPKAYSEGLLQTVLGIPSTQPHFHARLLEAFFADAKQWGHPEQYYQAKAIAHIFKIDALNSPLGTLDNGLFQFLLRHILGEADPYFRQEAIHFLFQSMEQGLSRAKLTDMILRFGYPHGIKLPERPTYSREFWDRHVGEAATAWGPYRPEDQVTLFDFVFRMTTGRPHSASQLIRIFGEGVRSESYPPEEIERALDYARAHPLGDLVVRRLLQIFTAGDSAGKLKELTRDRPEPGTLTLIERWEGMGTHPEKMAEAINGTRHNGYLDDMRLARKVVSVMTDIREFLRNPKKREKAKGRLDVAFWDFLERGGELGGREILDLLGTDPTPAFRYFKKMVEQGKVVIQVVPKELLLKNLSGTGAQDADALMIVRGDPSLPDRLLVKMMPNLDLSRREDQVQAYRQITYRLAAVAHEMEHWRHDHGYYQGLEEFSEPLKLGEMGREQRLVSEIMADLEGHRWRIRNLDQHAWEIARRLGEPLALYFRHFNEWGFFR